MQVREIMTKNPACCTADTNLQEVARLMLEHDCGLIPIVDSQENKKPIGTITDRDIAIRTVATGQNPLEIKASNVMTMGVTTVTPETSVQECCDVMENKKIRRVLVVDRNGGVTGIVAQADVAEYGQPELISDMVEEISEASPSPNRRNAFRPRNTQSFSSNRNFSSSPNRTYSTHRSFEGEENQIRYRREGKVRSNQESFWSSKTLLPLLLAVGAGAALKYYWMPENETTRRLRIKKYNDVGPSHYANRTMTSNSSRREVIPSTTQTTDNITGTVTSTNRTDHFTADLDTTENTDKTDTGVKRAAS